MECFKIDRVDRLSYGEDFSMIVIAEDELHAERKARIESEDFEKAKLKVTQIDMSIEQVILIDNTGA